MHDDKTGDGDDNDDDDANANDWNPYAGDDRT
jgi:hypothetical protein